MTAQVQEGGIIREVRIVGGERIEPETIRSYLTTQPGDAFDNAKLDASLKTLFATGLFADVSLARDGDALVVRVVENPVINRVAFEGNSHFDDKKLNDEVQLKPRSVYTRTRVQADVKRMLDLYRRSGRFAATVEPKVIQLPQNRVDLVFEISEGETTGIRSINFVGNKEFSTDDLQGVISTKESRWYRFFSSDDTYDPDRLTYDRELLRKFYLANGYADFRVASAVAELTPAKDGFIITITIDEGERYKFGKVGVNVALKDLTSDEMMPLLLTKADDWYNANAVDDTITKLTNYVGDHGYAFVDIRPLITRNREKHILDLTYDIAEGPRVYVERIDVSGNVRTLDRVIRREFSLAEGDAFNTSKLKRAENNLNGLGFFKKVDVTNVAGSAPDKTVVNVEVEEESTGELSLGAGFSSSYGLLGDFGIHEKNLLGRGQDLRLNGQISEYYQLIDLSFTEPYFLDRPLAFGWDLFQLQQNKQEYTTYDLFSLGGTLRLGFDLYQDLRDTLRYTLRQDRVTDIDPYASIFIMQQAGARIQSVVGQTLTYDKRINRQQPTGGYFVTFDESIAGLGGSVDYVKLVLNGGWYYSFAPEWVLGLTGEFGNVVGLGQNVGIQDRFEVGGDNLRGFAIDGIGPRDVTTRDSLGGNQYWVGSVTLSVPLGLPESLGISTRVFTDFGSLYGIDGPHTIAGSTDQIADSHFIRMTAGAGVSWKSPLGPIKIDMGLPIMKKEYDEREVIRVDFGTQF